MRFSKTKETTFYTPEQIEKRNEDIPPISFLPGSSKRPQLVLDFAGCEDIIKVTRRSPEAIPASIEYTIPFRSPKTAGFDVFEDDDANNSFMETGHKISRHLKENFGKELIRPDGFHFERAELRDLTKRPETAPEELLNISLASEEKVTELTRLHMALYAVLARVQEVRIATDLKAAYDIQDRISYVLDNPSLLMEELVDELIGYLNDIVHKLSDCEKEIRVKQARFNELNHRVSKLKEYKYKTDLSFQLIDDNKAAIESEIDRNLKILKDGESA